MYHKFIKQIGDEAYFGLGSIDNTREPNRSLIRPIYICNPNHEWEKINGVTLVPGKNYDISIDYTNSNPPCYIHKLKEIINE